MTSARTVSLLGSTGSIGTQALRIIEDHPDDFRVVALSAQGSDAATLARQALTHGVEVVGVAREDAAGPLRDAIAVGAEQAGRRSDAVRVLVGPAAATEVAGIGADVVVNGITGSIGLRPTLAALRCGSTLALANKESLIVGGDLVTREARPGQIVPVDSEHSAIAQCLRSGSAQEVRRLVLTASGGPFRGRTRAELARVTPAEALRHPNFAMGTVITTNSATLVNKGLEVIEAHYLFDVGYDSIEVVVHPQQQIHSMVEFRDGSTVAQMGPPRMLVPIALGLSWPDRLDEVDEPCDWSRVSQWDFAPLDDDAFPAVRVAREAGRAAGTRPAVYNAANEVCVEAFHAGRISFPAIVDTIAEVLDRHTSGNSADTGAVDQVDDIEQVLAADAWARAVAGSVMMEAQPR